MTTVARDVELLLAVETPSEANWGAGEPMVYYRDIIVEPTGEVLAYDEIAGHYTRLHGLSAAQVAACVDAARCGARVARVK